MYPPATVQSQCAVVLQDCLSVFQRTSVSIVRQDFGVLIPMDGMLKVVLNVQQAKQNTPLDKPAATTVLPAHTPIQLDSQHASRAWLDSS